MKVFYFLCFVNEKGVFMSVISVVTVKNLSVYVNAVNEGRALRGRLFSGLMPKKNDLWLLLSLLLLLPGLCFGENVVISRKITMEAHPGYANEFCAQNLVSGQRVLFKSQAPYALKFNVHHHHFTGIQYPIKQDISKAFNGQFIVDFSGEYCFMWQNSKQRSDAFNLYFQYAVQ